MIRIEKTDVYGWEAAIRGMRNPMNSWEKSDSCFKCNSIECVDCDNYAKRVQVEEVYWQCDEYARHIGDNDLKLMLSLAKGGAVHAKYRRMINVTCDITTHHAWWAEFDTAKVGTVRNSCSKMHKIHVKEFVKDDFSTEGIDECGGRTVDVFLIVMEELERLRRLFNETHEKKYWRAIIEMLPLGYNIKATVQMNYEVLTMMYRDRKNHKLDEWREFCKWIETLPYSELITGETKDGNET